MPMPRHPDRLIERLAQPAAARLIAASGTAVVATGSVEQHGGHLPLGTDAFAAQSVAERVADRLGTVAASLGPVGVAHYHLGWPGTLSLAPSTFMAVLVDVCGGLASAGATRILVVNWHEGNSAPLRLAAGEAQRRHGIQIVIAESHVITHSLFPDEMEFTHAGSMETAAVLAFDGSLVHLEDATPPSDLAAGEAAHALFRRPDVYPVLRDFHQVAGTGWYGRPERATPERAEEIAEAVADHVVSRAREIWAALPQAAPSHPGGPPGRTAHHGPRESGTAPAGGEGGTA
jgi:creatinine amidohydrolase